MRVIPLTRGLVALVDDRDFTFLSGWKWFAHPHGKNKRMYAARNQRVGGKRVTVLMHRVLLGITSGEVDHVDGDGLNNTRANIRPCSRAQNVANRDGFSSKWPKGVS
jgi:hypothetical protein